METSNFLNLYTFFTVLLLLEPSDSKVIPWFVDYTKAKTFPPESFGNLRELKGEFDGWNRLAELNGWEMVPGNSIVNGTEWNADDNPLECAIRFVGTSCNNSCGDFRSYYCSCDEYCHIYHSCCNDYETHCRTESERNLARYSKFIGSRIECVALEEAFYVISGCPESANVTLSKECSESKVEPMSVIHSGLHFKNSFCMQCFDVNDAVEKWKTSISVKRRGKRSVGSFDVSKFVGGSFETFPYTWQFTSKYLTRQCVPGMIHKCPKNTPVKLQRLCEYTHRPFKFQYKGSTNLELYENEFCADCHSRFLKNVSHCSYLSSEYFKPRHSSFKLLVSQEAPDNIVITSSILTPLSWVRIKCTSMVDKVPTGCQITDCRDNFELADGKCVEKKIEYSECFFLNFLITKEQTDDLDFDKFVNDVLLVTDEFLNGVNFTYLNYTMDSVSIPVSGDVRIMLRYDLMQKWIPDINVFISYVDYFESRGNIFDLRGDLSICTNSLKNVKCSMVSCFVQPNTKTIRLGGNNETNIAMTSPCASANCHNVFISLLVVLVIY